MSVNFKYLINSSKQCIYSRHFMKKIILIFFIFLASTAGYAQVVRPPQTDAGGILNQENDRQKSKEIPKQIPKSLLEKSKKKDIKSSEEKTLIKSFISLFFLRVLQHMFLHLECFLQPLHSYQ